MISIYVSDLTYAYDGNIRALNRVSINLKGNRIGIVGQNGSGKSTLLGVLMGFLIPQSGAVEMDGIFPYKNRDAILKRYTPSFEKVKFPYSIKVRDFVKFVGRLIGNTEDIFSLADEIGILSFGEQRMFQLSSGQEQLVWLFNSLADESKIPVLDEPFVHLDLHVYSKITDILLKRFKKYIITSHIPEDVELLTDNIVILEKGEAKWYGSIKELIKDNLYEVFVNSKHQFPDNVEILANFGNVIVCRCDREFLQKGMDSGIILGYKKAGVRALYAKFK